MKSMKARIGITLCFVILHGFADFWRGGEIVSLFFEREKWTPGESGTPPSPLKRGRGFIRGSALRFSSVPMWFYRLHLLSIGIVILTGLAVGPGPAIGTPCGKTGGVDYFQNKGVLSFTTHFGKYHCPDTDRGHRTSRSSLSFSRS